MDVAFKDAWAVADRIPGWFVECEGELLYRLASAVRPDCCLVEVGCYRGRSASLLATTGRKTYLVDPLKFGDVVDGRPVNAADVGDLTRFVAARDNVVWWNMTSDACPDPDELIGLLHVDGCHEGTWPRVDFDRFWSHMGCDSIVLFHDVDDSPSVRKTIDKLQEDRVINFIERAGGLAAFRMSNA